MAFSSATLFDITYMIDMKMAISWYLTIVYVKLERNCVTCIIKALGNIDDSLAYLWISQVAVFCNEELIVEGRCGNNRVIWRNIDHPFISYATSTITICHIFDVHWNSLRAKDVIYIFCNNILLMMSEGLYHIIG